MSPISVHNQSRLDNSNIKRSDERKWFYIKKGQKQTIPHTNDDRHRLHRWHSASDKYTYPSKIPAAESGAGSRWHWSPSEYQQNGVHVF